MGISPVAYHGEYRTMDGRQTVLRAEMTAVIRALLAIKVSGHGVAHVTIWSDSKVVVQGYNKGKSHTLQLSLIHI
eukprot:4268678-Karenia_brevis.AAC.1